MKRLTAFLILLLISFSAVAQLEVKPNSFKEVPGFININIEKQADDNEVPYAVLKVKTENINDKQRRELLFEGDAATFIECEYKVGEVWVYLTYKATYLKISHRDLSSTEFWFPFDMEPKKGYEMILVNNATTSNDEILERLKQLEEAQKNQPEPQIVYVEKPVEPKPEPVVPAIPKKPMRTFVMLNLSNNTYNKAAFGVTVGTMRKFGVFATFMTNGVFTNLGVEGQWEHMKSAKIQAILDANPSYRAETSYVSMSAIFGFIFKVAGPINFKIGGGYSANSLWVLVYNTYNKRTDYWASDYSSYGFGGLVGVQAHLGHFAISIDGATTNFSVFEGRIGLGYCFGKTK